MSAIESAGSFTMPPLTGTLDGLWDVILDLAEGTGIVTPQMQRSSSHSSLTPSTSRANSKAAIGSGCA
jgi:hypothetical protein